MASSVCKAPSFSSERRSVGALMLDVMSAPVDEVVPYQPADLVSREQLIAEMADELESLREEARQSGYREGLASGHADGQASAQEAFSKRQATLDKIIAQADSELASWRQAVCDEAVDLAQQALVRMLGENVLNAGLIEGLIRQVAASLTQSEVLAIRLHPKESASLKTSWAQRQNESERPEWLDRVREDEGLTYGGVVIDTPRGQYRATLDVQLHRLAKLLDEHRANTPTAVRAVRCA